MGRRLVKGALGVGDIRQLDSVSPFERVCQPEDVAEVVRFLVSDGAAYLTGQRIYVDGGGLGYLLPERPATGGDTALSGIAAAVAHRVHDTVRRGE